MSKAYNVLVTGCGGDIGQSIGKVLKGNPLIAKTFGCDLHSEHAGTFIFDTCFIVEKASSPQYLKGLQEIIETHKIDFLIPATEHELIVFLREGVRAFGNC